MVRFIRIAAAHFSCVPVGVHRHPGITRRRDSIHTSGTIPGSIRGVKCGRQRDGVWVHMDLEYQTRARSRLGHWRATCTQASRKEGKQSPGCEECETEICSQGTSEYMKYLSPCVGVRGRQGASIIPPVCESQSLASSRLVSRTHPSDRTASYWRKVPPHSQASWTANSWPRSLPSHILLCLLHGTRQLCRLSGSVCLSLLQVYIVLLYLEKIRTGERITHPHQTPVHDLHHRRIVLIRYSIGRAAHSISTPKPRGRLH